MNNICKILKNAVERHKKVYITVSDFYDYIESKDADLRNLLNYPKYFNKFKNAVNTLVKENVIMPVKSSKYINNSVKEKYKIVQNSPDYRNLKLKILKLNKPIDISYYLSRPEQYQKDKEYIEVINNFLDKKSDRMSINERSYELFRDEKFLRDGDKSRAKGERILKNLGLTYEDLNCFYTYEPFFCFTKNGYTKQTKKALIIENKDTFWSFKKLIFDLNADLPIDLLIYGEGNKIVNSFQFVKEYNFSEKDQYLYFGDLDAEGINIFFSLKHRYELYKIKPFNRAYKELIDKGIWSELKRKQNTIIENVNNFITYFDDEYGRRIKNNILNNRYIPQEGINYKNLRTIYSV